jgi:hypothetical protein
VRGGGGEVRVTQTAKDAEVRVWCGCRIKKLMWYGEVDGLTRADIEKEGGSGESFGPIGRWHVCLKKKGAGDVVKSTDGALGLAILLRSIWARETKVDAMLGKVSREG